MGFCCASDRPLDLICLGRLGIDLNCNDHNCELHHVKSFSPTVGGSPANIAIGAARLGIKVGFIGRVSNDKFGTFILETLALDHVDTTCVVRDMDGAKNCLAVTEIITPQNSGSILYRDNVADLNLTYADVKEEYIAKAKVLLVSGTALARSPSREAALLAAYYARKNNVKVALDLDYRPYTWRCPEESSLYYRMFCEKSDMIIGTKEEFAVLQHLWSEGEEPGDEKMVRRLMADGAEVVIVKDGSRGSVAWTESGAERCGIYPADLKKTFGAGDAFAAGLLAGLTNGKTLKDSMMQGAAAASIVISRYSCSASSPYTDELESFMEANQMVD